MKKLFLDLDDTYKDTERYLRSVLKANSLAIPKQGTVYRFHLDIMYKDIFEMVFSDYSVIPNKEGAEENLRILETEYEIIFCSSYTTDSEKCAKQSYADGLGKEIILCGGSQWDKSHVNMLGESFIDDNARILALSNATKKIQMYNPYSCVGLRDYSGDPLVLDWFSALDHLVEVSVDEQLRERFCKRIKECSSQTNIQNNYRCTYT